MSFYSIASSKSIWRGYDYYKEGKIRFCDKITDTEFVGACAGSNGEEYEFILIPSILSVQPVPALMQRE